MKIKTLLSLFGFTLMASAQPSVISLVPLNGSGTTATFTSVYRHTGGVNQNYLGYLLILPTPNIVWFTATGSCLIEHNRISNGMRLINDAGTGWLGGDSGVPVGAGGTILTNSYCTVNTTQVTRTLVGNDMTVTVPVTFKGTLTGAMGTFLQSLDVTGVWTGMTQFGNWTSTAITTPKPGPYVRQVLVPAYDKVPTKVDAYSGHSSGLDALYTVNVLVAENIVGGTRRCHIIYFGGTRELRLVNDAGTGFTTNSPQQNSTCAIGRVRPNEEMFASGQGNELFLHIPMVFNPDITTRLNVWVNTFDNSGNLTHWIGAQ
jgi:hypothetical protein